MKTYIALYAEDVPHYGTVEIEAENDAEAIAKAKAGPFETDDPDWDNTVCKRIVHIEDPEGKLIAVDVPLDDYMLSRAAEDLRLKIGATGEMLLVLERAAKYFRDHVTEDHPLALEIDAVILNARELA